ncbi:MAG: hypothetical protein AAFW75_05885 [Cyanobacteria bacterium J06636_16]
MESLISTAQKLFQEMMTATAVLKLEHSAPITDEVLPQALDRIRDIIRLIKQTVNANEQSEEQRRDYISRQREYVSKRNRALRGDKAATENQEKPNQQQLPRIHPARPAAIKAILRSYQYRASEDEEQVALQALGDLLDAGEVQPRQEVVETIHYGLGRYRGHTNQISLDLLERHDILDRIAVQQWQKENGDQAPVSLDDR